MEREFVFGEHILRFEDPALKFLGRFPLIKGAVDFLLSNRALLQSNSNRVYGTASEVFSKMKSGMCRANFMQANGRRFVQISGSGIESFTLDGDAYFEISDDKKAKTTYLPVIMGGEKGELIFFDYPSVPLYKFSKIEVDYRFRTEFNLGEDFAFTKRPSKIYRYDSFTHEQRYLYYGDEGRVQLRAGDAMFMGLCRSVMGRWIYPYVKRDKLGLAGQITLVEGKDRKSIYIGNVDSTGSFPFYLDNEERMKESPSPVTPVLATK